MKVLSLFVGCILFSFSLSGQIVLTDLKITFESSVKTPYDGMYMSFFADFSIIKKDNEYYAISNSNNFVGVIKEPLWQQQLSQQSIQSIQDFLKKLEVLPHHIAPVSYYNDQYTVHYQGKTWTINPNVNLLGYTKKELKTELPILEFYATIFDTEINNLYQKRLTHQQKVNQLITRKWYFNPTAHQAVKKGAILTFSSTSTKDKSAFLNIRSDFSIDHSLIKQMPPQARIDIEYDLNLISNTQFLYLSTPNFEDFVTRIDKEPGDLNTSFYIIELTDKTLKLQVN